MSFSIENQENKKTNRSEHAAHCGESDLNVSFSGNFWGHNSRGHAGAKIPVNKQFQWTGRRWLIPAAYSCGKGLVLDFCMEIPPEEIRSFMEHWNLTPETERNRQFSREEEMRLVIENPLHFDFRPLLQLNGKEIASSHSCSAGWNPCLPEIAAKETETKKLIDRYRLDPDSGWIIYRFAFPWHTKRRSKLNTLSVTLEQEPVSVPGPHFQIKAAGDTFDFVFPENGQPYTLTVQSFEQETLEFPRSTEQDLEFPACCTVIGYTITPELPKETLTISDCAESDPPRQKSNSPSASSASGISSFGFMVGNFGSASITPLDGLRSACSSLHFEPVENVDWFLIFHEKQFEDLTLTLISC